MRNKTCVNVTPAQRVTEFRKEKEHPYWTIKPRHGMPRKTKNPATENRIFCRGKSCALHM